MSAGSVSVGDSPGAGIRGEQQGTIGAHSESGIRAREVPHKERFRSRMIVVNEDECCRTKKVGKIPIRQR